MVAGGEGTTEGGTGLTVGHERVGKEQAGLSREAVGHLTGLAHEAVLHLHGVVDTAAVTDDGVLADDTRADIHGSVTRRHDGTLQQTSGTVHLAVALDDGISDVLCIDNLHVVANDAPLGTLHAQLVLNELGEALLQHLVLGMLHHEGCQLGVQFAEDNHVAVAHLVEHGDGGTLAEGGIISGLERRDVRDKAVVTDCIVVDVVTYLLNQTVVTHAHVAEGGIVDARVLEEALGHLNLLVEFTQADIAIEHHSMEIIRFKAFGYHYSLPVFAPANIVFQNLDFTLCQLSIITHNCRVLIIMRKDTIF